MGKIANAWYGTKSFYYVNEKKFDELKDARDYAREASKEAKVQDSGVWIEDRDHRSFEHWKQGKKVGA